MKDYCSMSPDKLFGIYFGDACKLHDKAYSESNGKGFWKKAKADLLLGYRIAKKSKRLIPVGFVYFIVTLFLGGFWWGRKHGK